MIRGRRRFVAYWYCNGAHLSLGLHIDFEYPHMEIHLPCGFIRIGWVDDSFSAADAGIACEYRFLYRSFGIGR